MVCTPGQNFSDKLMFPMLIKGTSAQKQYKPYIPSVKMLAEEVNQQKNDLSEIHDLAIGANFSGVAKYMKIGKMICCHINIICTSDVAPYGDIVSNFPSPISDVTYYKENGIQIFVSKNNTWSTCSSTIPKDIRIESYISYIAQ